MLKKIKIWLSAALAVIVLVLCAYTAFRFTGSSSLVSSLPLPEDARPYAIFESDGTEFPTALTALLTEGTYAQFHEGTSRNVMLSVTETAQKSALLAEEDANGFVEIYSVMRFSSKESRALRRGELPDSWRTKLKSPKIEAGSEKDTWLLRCEGVSEPVYFKTERKLVLMAADTEPFKRMLDVADGSEKSASVKWKTEKKWPAHALICDGGRVFARGRKDLPPLKLTAAWHSLEPKSATDPAGEIKWNIEGLEGRIGSAVLGSLKAREWQTDKYYIPNPPLFTMGLSVAGLKGSAEDWPFPLSSMASVGHSMGLSDSLIREILSNETVVSLGGQNHLLWFTLPGFMVQLSGNEKQMKEVVDAFWGKLFLGAETKAVAGFDFGGTANVPFSALAAGRGDTALLGLIAPESINTTLRLGNYLKSGEKAIGWVVADLPRIAKALREMTAMNSFVNDEDEEMEDDTDAPQGSAGGTPEEERAGAPDGKKEQKDEKTYGQSGGSFSIFDRGITDAFSNVISRFGKVLLVWSEPDSGTINWYKAQKKK